MAKSEKHNVTPGAKAANTVAADVRRRSDLLPSKATPTPLSPRWKQIGLGLFILLITFAVYWPSLRGEYLWDDDVLLTENPLVHRDDGLKSIWFSTKPHDYFPLTLTSLWVEWRLWRMNSLGYHVVNVALHGLGAILLWRVLRRLKIPGCWLAAILFAVHPVCVASGAWISEGKNTLSLIFYLLAALFYLRILDSNPQESSRSNRISWYILSLIAFLLALLSKTSVVMLPVLLLGCSLWLHGRISRQDILRSIPFFLLSLAFGLITVWFQTHRAIGYKSDELLVRLLGGTWAVWFYLFKALLPVNLSMIYPRWEISPGSLLAWLPGLFLLGSIFLLWRFRKTWGRPLLFALGYFLLTLAPVLGLFDMSYFAYARAADHLQYLSLIGIVAFIPAVIAKISGRLTRSSHPTVSAKAPPVGVQASACSQGQSTAVPLNGLPAYSLTFLLITFFSILSWQRSHVFATAENLWRDTAKKNPKAWAAHNNLGNNLAGKKQLTETISELEIALRLYPNYADAHNNLGNAFADSGRLEEAVPHYQTALKLRPDFAYAQNNLGFALARLNRFDEAVSHYRRALEINPDYVYAHNNLALTLSQQKKYDEAVEHFRTALRLNPKYPEARANLANVLSDMGKLDEAIVEFQAALQLRPNHPETCNSLGVALAMKGNLAEATRYFSEAVRLEPSNAFAIINLGNILAQQGRLDEAIEKYQASLLIEPNDPGARSNLGSVLVQKNRLDEAIKHFKIALEVEPANPKTHFNCGIALARQGKRDEALARFREALRLKPDYAEAQQQLDLLTEHRQN